MDPNSINIGQPSFEEFKDIDTEEKPESASKFGRNVSILKKSLNHKISKYKVSGNATHRTTLNERRFSILSEKSLMTTETKISKLNQLEKNLKIKSRPLI